MPSIEITLPSVMMVKSRVQSLAAGCGAGEEALFLKGKDLLQNRGTGGTGAAGRAGERRNACPAQRGSGGKAYADYKSYKENKQQKIRLR